TLAKKLGLPQPARLRRWSTQTPLLPGPLLILGDSPTAQQLADTLVQWGLDVRRHDAGGAKLGGLILLLDGLTHPDQLSPLMLKAGDEVRQLVP
ncbi:hypothetical protein OFB62_28235, partial [Escherichia coli]|nr:hypothetical protein [Escherichia coli]